MGDHDNPRDDENPPPDRLAGPTAPAQRSPEARHDDDLSPAKIRRDRAEESPTERMGDGTPTGPITSRPASDER